MEQYHCDEGAGSQVHERGVPAKEGRVGELEQRSQECRCDGGMGMGEGEFIQVMDVGDAKVERGEEDDPGGLDVGEEMERDEEGAEENLLSDGASDVVSEADTAAEGVGEGIRPREPVLVGLFHDQFFEQRAQEEEGG